jgi:hypothetical protein
MSRDSRNHLTNAQAATALITKPAKITKNNRDCLRDLRDFVVAEKDQLATTKEPV